MAYCDYQPCKVCGNKAFYDAVLNYYDHLVNSEGHPVPDSGGDIAGLCSECAKTYKLVAVLKDPSGAEGDK